MYDWIMHDVFVNDRHHYDDDCSYFRIAHVTTSTKFIIIIINITMKWL